MSNAIMSTSTQGNGVTRHVRRAGLLATVFGALAASSVMAGPTMQNIEACLESGTDLLSLPGVPGGALTAKECTACSSVQLSFGPNTRYFIGKEAVSYNRLREAASKGDLRLDVFYRSDTHVLTRVRLAASADANQQ